MTKNALELEGKMCDVPVQADACPDRHRPLTRLRLDDIPFRTDEARYRAPPDIVTKSEMQRDAIPHQGHNPGQS